MANGRFLSKTIAQSAQLATVSDAAEVLFYRMIPHLDINGRLEGAPRLVKATTCPLKEEFTVERISDLLYELAETKDSEGEGLIVWYQAKGKQVIQFPGFSRHQALRTDREAKSRLPALGEGAAIMVRRRAPRGKKTSTAGGLRGNSGTTPAEVKVSEVQVEVEVQGEVKSLGAAPRIIPGGWPADFAAMYEPIGLLVPGRLGRTLKPVVDRYGPSVAREMWDYYIRIAPHLRFGKLDPEVRDTSRMSPDDFVRNAGTWYEKTRPIGGAGAVAAY